MNQTKDAKRLTIVSNKISMFLDSTMCNQLQMFFVSFGLGWEVNSAWLITELRELANQRARKALFTCVVYNVMYTPRRRWKGFSELATTKKPVGILNLKLFYILMQI